MASILLIVALIFPTSTIEGNPDAENSPTFDRYYFDGEYSYLTKTIDYSGTTEDNLSFDSIRLTWIKSQFEEQGSLKMTVLSESEVVLEELYSIYADSPDSIYIISGDSWIEITEYGVIAPMVFPAVFAILAGVLSGLTIADVTAIMFTIFATSVIAIEYDNLKQSIIDAFSKDDPEVVITEEIIGEITIILIDGVPSALHNGETDKAGYYVDFETEFLKSLDPDDHFAVCVLDDEFMICPVPISEDMVFEILDFNSPLYHVWTLYPDRATVGIHSYSAHVVPYFDECNVNLLFPHWHPCCIYESHYSVSFFGLCYDDYSWEEGLND